MRCPLASNVPVLLGIRSVGQVRLGIERLWFLARQVSGLERRGARKQSRSEDRPLHVPAAGRFQCGFRCAIFKEAARSGGTGRRSRLKICRGSLPVWVRLPPPGPFFSSAVESAAPIASHALGLYNSAVAEWFAHGGAELRHGAVWGARSPFSDSSAGLDFLLFAKLHSDETDGDSPLLRLRIFLTRLFGLVLGVERLRERREPAGHILEEQPPPGGFGCKRSGLWHAKFLSCVLVRQRSFV
jgi:hypothetical protein